MIGIVDDDSLVRKWMLRLLTKEGLAARAFSNGHELLDAISRDIGVVCLDLGLEGMEGMELLQILRDRHPDLSVIVITGETRAEIAVQAMKHGAYDYLIKPLDSNRVLSSIHRAIERHRLVREVNRLRSERITSTQFVGESPQIQEIKRQIDRLADSDVAVCILGETGTGKEVIARILHETSSRSQGPFIALNCAAIPESLEESELFGHEKGAFSGATIVRKGRFELANKGTLFLDEVGDMAPSTQAALLRTLQQKSIQRLGGSQEIPIDTRIVSATHRNLQHEVTSGSFRQDLYYRLVVYPILLPPLRERRTDIPLLVAHFLRKLRGEKPDYKFHPDSLALLIQYDWPGNVRELENVLQRTLLTCDTSEIEPRHLPPEIRGGSRPPSSPFPSMPPRRQLWEAEKEAIQRALAEANGHVGRAAEILGISRATLYRRLATWESNDPRDR